ncbi:glycine--tRNA ligase subunit beta [Sandarakinorhabdus cyanobacteriorum]|uniref:Glycine--tRNA ligase beta subunit n=1 Tax=Sandarakinorhabdus cyanobacteriorum TaxID=1981098 RepID=A0A255Y750_9SPHN|nr:glycine--tRNA ligase subunit beta [Sandarakinorhabdus cyanobacteriorum]OYQ25049.1 glycine--tRNA ligase subunit beta [Sandarakinorhabdus cyanobacteriorum]
MKFLLELQSEEIPARMQAAAAEQLKTRFVEAMKAAGLAHGTVTADATPRRLWLLADDVAAASAGSAEEVKGPAATAPAQAIEGFLKKTGLTREQLEERETPKGVVLFAVIRREGRTAAEILAEAIPQIVTGFAWPKSMRWGAASASTASPRWVRPLTGILALLDHDVVPCSVFGLTSGRETRGHRIHAPGVLSITSAETWADQLRAAHVLVASAERQQIIATRAEALAADAGLTLIPDAGLVAENAGLTEWPVPLLGRFDPDFLSVPREVIVLTMRTNQKYFALADSAGALAPAFICVANLEANDGGAAIINGNQRVLSARLSDARFFWEQDLAAVKANGLEGFLPKLSDIVFHERLGTLAEKVERVAALARWLCESGALPADPALAERAARLAKADLVSATVGEFPEVQGLIGRYLALAVGIDPAIADAIRDHYKPAGQGDDVPTQPVSVAVALADKLDTLFGFFSADMPPTGSKDPFALRRQALGVLSILSASETRLPLRAVMRQYIVLQKLSGFEAGWMSQLMDFFADRLKVQQREAGVRHDLIDAVFALGGEDDFVRLLARVKALQAFVETEDGTNLLAGYKRTANILKAAEKDPPSAEPATGIGDGAEAALSDALDAALPQAQAAVADERFTDAMAALAALRGPVDGFFDAVMVNDPDPAVRARRLALLARFRDAVHGVADFSHIEG